jgi:hypothetical protein
MYHKKTDLTLILSQNYIFKVKYRKTANLVTILSQTCRFNDNLITKLDIYNSNITLVQRI